VFVGLERVGPELWLTVENGAPRDGETEAGAASDQGGHGIRGMMERMTSVGGSLEHGVVPGGGYRVVARAPHPLPPPGGAVDAVAPDASHLATGAEGTA
jgi:signal transduction histidine kinase